MHGDGRQTGRIRGELPSQGSKIGKTVSLEHLGQFRRQRSLAVALMRQGKQLDGDLAGLPFGQPVDEPSKAR
ncbi:hypothetical protein JHW44_17195 (plasmid) [Paracoccus seriniphilus]|nr:hypothetical protein JHW44_17195 [Paracoccus seriniphilus]